MPRIEILTNAGVLVGAINLDPPREDRTGARVWGAQLLENDGESLGMLVDILQAAFELDEA